MAEVEYDQPSYGESRPSGPAGPTGIIALVIDWRLARDTREAERVLLYFFLGLLVFGALIWIFFSPGKPSISPSQYLQEASQRQTL
ncbi:MAG: hypothetical protein ACREGR_01410 [Minisyncoccia bacterium]